MDSFLNCLFLFVLWPLWATVGIWAVLEHEKRNPGIFVEGLCLFAIFFGPLMIAESISMERRNQWIRGEITDEEYFK